MLSHPASWGASSERVAGFTLALGGGENELFGEEETEPEIVASPGQRNVHSVFVAGAEGELDGVYEPDETLLDY